MCLKLKRLSQILTVKRFIYGGVGMEDRGTVWGFWGASKSPQKDSRCGAARKILGGFLGGSEDMLPRKSLKLEPLRLAKNASPV